MTTPNPRTDSSSTAVVGFMLLAVGVVWLLAAVFDFNIWSVAWPMFVIVPGLAILVSGLASPQPDAGGVVPGAVITTTGLLLLYQAVTGHWTSWAYAWALIAPTSVGAALVVVGTRRNDEEMERGGRAAMKTGLALFVVGLVLFEFVIGISGRDFGRAGDIALPTLLILLGALVLFRRRPER